MQITSTDAMWREYGRKIHAYDPAGKGLLQLAQDYARSSRRYSVMAGTHHMGIPAAFPLADLEAEMGRLALIEEAIEELGGMVDPFSGVGTVYAPDRGILARF